MVQLEVGGRIVAEYVVEPAVDSRLAPRPYLHPVRTLSGTVVSDVLPDDHPHHLGVSIAVQDVAKNNLWGGRTYVRESGYTWLDDHGRIVHAGFEQRTADRVVQRLRWCDRSGATLLDERRQITAMPVSGFDDAWVLGVAFVLAAPHGRAIELGSPATNGRPGGSGYGGFFWRAPAGDVPPDVFTEAADGEDAVNGSTEPWVAMTTRRYGLVFTGLGSGDHWFVRAADYPGVCAALAYERPLVVAAGETVSRHHRVVVVDGRLDRAAAAKLAQQAQGHP
jgi:hypothetical protein